MMYALTCLSALAQSAIGRRSAYKKLLCNFPRGEFSQTRGSARKCLRSRYQARNLDDVCSHMEPSLHNVPRGYWDVKENVAAEALKWNGRNQFERGSKGAFKAAKKYGWYDEVTQHFTPYRSNYWNYERCKEVAAQYTNRTTFNQNEPGAYNAARRNGGWTLYASI